MHNYCLSDLLTEQPHGIRKTHVGGKQASDPGSHRLARLAKQDSLSRCVNPMTRIVPDGLNYSG